MTIEAGSRISGNRAGRQRAARSAGGSERGLRQSMRGFLDFARRIHPDEVITISTPVNRRFDMTATVFELQDCGRYPVLIFANVEGFDMPVVTNIAANRRLLSAALDVEPDQLPGAYRERCQNYQPVEVVGDAPWQDVVWDGQDVDLAKLPIPVQFSVDGAPYITAGQICARDPETGVDTTGFHRLMLKGKNRLGVSLHSRRRMYEFHRRAEARGDPLPAAITIGIHPVHYMGSMAYHYPPGVRKYEVIGALFGEPYRLARCGTADLEVPWGAEIVVEGEILNDVREPEGPFGEFTGYASYRSTQNVFVAHRVQMRRDAMFHSVTSGMAADHILVSCISREAELLNSLRRNQPNVLAVHVPTITCGALMAIIKMKKTAEGQPQQAIMAAMGTEIYCKCVVVVDEDVDIFNLSDVMWAVITRTRADRDLMFVHRAMGAVLDPSSDPQDNTLTKMGIDATKPGGQDHAQRLLIADDQRARAREIMAAAGIRI